MTRPSRIFHADWSIDPRKRWLCAAHLHDDGSYVIAAPVLLPDLPTLITTLHALAQAGEAIAFGLDLPIGVPLAYAQRAGIDDFLTWLPTLGEGAWADFFSPADSPQAIGLARPFYPARAGGTRKSDLTSALGIAVSDLRRRCDAPAPGRRAAGEMFWTMGAQQVGKAAISGWRDLLIPLLRQAQTPVGIWTFSGMWDDLIAPGRVAFAEGYPAEFYGQVGVRFTSGDGGKRAQAARRAQAPAVLAAIAAADGAIRLEDAAHAALLDGFGADAAGEDRFDCVVSAIGMARIALGLHPVHEPADAAVRRIEGWILGMPAI